MGGKDCSVEQRMFYVQEKRVRIILRKAKGNGGGGDDVIVVRLLKWLYQSINVRFFFFFPEKW